MNISIYMYTYICVYMNIYVNIEDNLHMKRQWIGKIKCKALITASWLITTLHWTRDNHLPHVPSFEMFIISLYIRQKNFYCDKFNIQTILMNIMIFIYFYKFNFYILDLSCFLFMGGHFNFPNRPNKLMSWTSIDIYLRLINIHLLLI